MKRHLLFLFCCFHMSLFAQTAPDTTKRQNFTTKEIQFINSGTTLAGTIFKPRAPSAAVVLVHGSGQEKRMIEMASLLATEGIAVLTYDKRGVGKSGGVYAGPEVGTNNIDAANLNLLALDASAAAKVLLAQLPAYHGPLGLIGSSQAGWIIPLAAKKNRKISFIVLFSGPVVTTPEQMRFQFYTAGNSKFWDTHTEAEAREHIRNDADRYQFTGTDPRDALAKLHVRGLWLFGGKDVQIPVVLSMEHLDAMQAQGKPYVYQLFPELGHNMAFTKSREPVNLAIQWIKALHTKPQQR